MRLLLFTILIFAVYKIYSQPIPAKAENIPFLVTFGGQADKSWGDDDYCQTIFFVIPENYKNPFYIRVFDPETSGQFDERKTDFNTQTKFSIYGGKSCITNPDAQKVNPEGKYRSGNLLAEKIFSSTNQYDNKWYTFRPISPTEGELSKDYGGYVFKLIVQGLSGDDGNLYRLYLSTKPNINESVEGSNSFSFEWSFRLHDNPSEVSHLYPYINDSVVSVQQYNFDWDNDGKLFFVSVLRKAVEMKKSPDNKWIDSKHNILDGERGSSLDIQMHKNKTSEIKNNNIVFYILNQYGEALPFFNIPIGGVPKPKSSIKLTPSKK